MGGNKTIAVFLKMEIPPCTKLWCVHIQSCESCLSGEELQSDKVMTGVGNRRKLQLFIRVARVITEIT